MFENIQFCKGNARNRAWTKNLHAVRGDLGSPGYGRELHHIPILKGVIFCEHPVKKGWSNIEMLSYLETRESDDTNCT